MQRGFESGAGHRVEAPYGMHPGCRSAVSRHSSAFTLLEIMMVVAIIGLMMTMSVPAILRTMHQEPLRKAVNDVVKICSHARAQAILHGQTTTVVFHPRSGDVTLATLGGGNSMKDPDRFNREDRPIGGQRKSVSSASALNSTHFGDGVNIDMLDINFKECKDADTAWVQFFPNGTSDEMTLVLDAGGQYRKISLEVTTGLTFVHVIQ